jgi:hypothetical protein
MTTRQPSILENQLRAITPEQLQILILGTSIYWGYFTVSSQEVSTMALAISLMSDTTLVIYKNKGILNNTVVTKFRLMS